MASKTEPTQDSPAPAIIYVDGEEFIRLQSGDNFNFYFDETTRREEGWREVALMVWKPRHGAYLRTRLALRSGPPPLPSAA